jgi:hypothetical protein
MSDSTPALLKEEINETVANEHSLAKWKLAISGLLGAAAFGLWKESGATHYWLLIFIPYVCAYIDLYLYQDYLKIQVIARFLREHDEDPILQAYERECGGRRKDHVFDLGATAGLLCSVVTSLGGPGFGAWFYLCQLHQSNCLCVIPWPFRISFSLWLVGMFLVVLLYLDYRRREEEILGSEPQNIWDVVKAELKAIREWAGKLL